MSSYSIDLPDGEERGIRVECATTGSGRSSRPPRRVVLQAEQAEYLGVKSSGNRRCP